jgi:two-component system NtrC family sensor kinase
VPLALSATVAAILALVLVWRAREAVVARTRELEDVRRVLGRVWWLGQQISLELDPERVLERFLEAVIDIAQAHGGAVGLLREDGKIHVVAASGAGAPLLGSEVPLGGSAMGRVLRGGGTWSVADIADHRSEVYLPVHDLCQEPIHGFACVPIARRGERIGAVSLVTRERREFTAVQTEYVAAMADVLSVSLENAELVENLRQAEWRFRTLFRAAPDAVFTVLQSGRIREANDAVRDVTGFDARQAVGRAFVDLVVEADRARLQEALDKAFSGTPARLEVIIAAPPDAFAAVSASTGSRVSRQTRRHVALAISKLPQADPPSVLLVGRDMTGEREMRVRLMESDRLAAVGELVAGVAHEVNNPLSSISAFAQLLLRDGALTASQRDSVDVIRAEALRASQVVKDLLAFARRSEPQREPLDLNGVVGRTLRMRGYQLSSSNVGLELALAPDLPAVVGDARQLQQVCLNLVTNAIQAMAPLGGGTLAVSTRAEAGGARVVLEMRDTGPGIPEGARERIFEPFFTTKKEGEGTGLGLSVSYGIVNAHGGTIEVADTSGAGTTFRVTLPAADGQDSAPSTLRRASGPLSLRSPLAGTRLLFVDDEPALRTGMEAFGALRGFTVLSAPDGRAALDLVRKTGVDAIVCDLRMPGMDGLAFLEQLRRERPGLAARTIFLTGDVLHASAGSTGAPGPELPSSLGLGTARQPVLAKPFAFEKLEEMLVTILRATPTAATR